MTARSTAVLMQEGDVSPRLVHKKTIIERGNRKDGGLKLNKMAALELTASQGGASNSEQTVSRVDTGRGSSSEV